MTKRETGKIGGKCTKEVILENIETREITIFNSASESDLYARETLGFTKKEMEALRHEPVNGFRRVRRFQLLNRGNK